MYLACEDICTSLDEVVALLGGSREEQAASAADIDESMRRSMDG